MGCCNEKMQMMRERYSQLVNSEEEEVIKIKEKAIPFSKTKIKELDVVIKKNQYEGIMSIAQLRKALVELNFDLEDFTMPEDHIAKLLKILQNPKRLYDVKTVMLCGILLGEGVNKEKANMLFKIYDKKHNDRISKKKITAMIREIIDLSACKIPMIAIDDNEEPQTFTLPSHKITAYSNMLLVKKEVYITEVLNQLMGESNYINLDEFVKKICGNLVLESLLWTYQVRLSLQT